MIPPKKAIGPSKQQRKKNFVPCKSIAVDEWTVGFKHKVIFQTYNPKKNNEVGHHIICISWKWHWLCLQDNSKLWKTYRWHM
jgi:hypothetical protein